MNIGTKAVNKNEPVYMTDEEKQDELLDDDELENDEDESDELDNELDDELDDESDDESDDEGDELDDAEDDVDEDEDEEERDKKPKGKKKLEEMSKDELLKVASSALRQKARLKGRLEKKSTEDKNEKQKPEKDKERRSSDVNMERIEFRQDHPNLTRKDVDQIERLAKANKMSLEKALREPIIRSYLKDRSEKRDSDRASISNNSSGAPLRKRNAVDWSSASAEDFEKRRKKILSQQK